MNGKVLSFAALLAVSSATRCETGFAMGDNARCFLDEPLASMVNGNKWGWSNAVRKADLPVTMPIWGGAAHCETWRGIHQANLEVRAAANGKVELEVVPLPGATVSEVHLFAGSTPLPLKRQGRNSVPTTSPGDFPQQSQSSLGPFEFAVGDDFHVVVHTNACGPDTPPCTPVASTTATVRVGGVELTGVAADATTWQVGGVTMAVGTLPEHLLGAEVKGYALGDQTTPVEAGTTVRVECPANCEGASCAVTLAHYHCPPCGAANNGGLTSLLRGQGIDVGSCVPQFQAGMQSFGMVGYHVQVAEGEAFEFEATTKPLQHFAVFVRHNVEDCSTAADAASCVVLDRCGWDPSELVCRSRWCASTNVIRPQNPACIQCAPTE